MNRTEEAAHARLADAMDKRRVELRKRWEDIAHEARITTAHLRNFRRGDRALGRLAVAGVEEALEWAPGSFDRVLAGEDPIPRRRASPEAEPRADREASDPIAKVPTSQLEVIRERMLAQLSDEERAEWEREMAEIKKRLDELQARRDLLWARLMSGDSIGPEHIRYTDKANDKP